MATLVSAGVDVQIINEGFYGSAGTGTVPLFVIATASSKAAVGGTGIAPGTVPAQAGALFLATSQRELAINYGAPKFYSVNGTPLHGHELNEYGLHGAYSFLGINNRAYMLRADIDLAALEAAATAPAGLPVSGTHWLDLVDTTWGLFQSDGTAIAGSGWIARTVKTPAASDLDGSEPDSSYGSNGDFAVVTQTNVNAMYEKIAGAWYRLDNTVGSGTWRAQRPVEVRSSVAPVSFPANASTMTFTSGSLAPFTVTFSSPADLAAVASQINSAATGKNLTATVVSNTLILTQTTGENLIVAGTSGALTPLGITAATYRSRVVNYSNTPQYPATYSVAGSLWVKLSSANNGANWRLRRFNGTTGQWVNVTVPFYVFNATLADSSTSKDAEVRAAVPAPATGFIYAGFYAATGIIQLRRWNGTIYEALTYEASEAAPSTDPEDGTLWYSSNFRADIMVNVEGTKWVGYQIAYPNTDPAGVIIAGSAPAFQADGSTALVENDLWLDASDLENYPRLYRWNDTRKRWALIDKTDQTTPFGVVFADARENAGPVSLYDSTHTVAGSELAEEIVLSNFLDPDAPDARSYPEGMLLFNTRYSTYNVKVWRPLHFVEGGFDANTNFGLDEYTVGEVDYAALGTTNVGRWVTASGNREDGSPYMGRKAQRIMIVRAMAATIATNEDIRSEAVNFNLIAAPGYPELVDEMITLNTDSKEVAFIVGDTPARLAPSGTAIQSWATNMTNVPATGEDGLTAANPYVGIYYPWGLGTNLDGTEVMIPPSTIALRTIAYNDSVAYPWFAPAGFQRGLVTNATSVGYLTAEDEYRPVILNQGQRDVLYVNKINPIAFLPGRGLVVYGQKTLEPLASALDRVNVARLTNYLRYNLDNIVKPFLFEQNDTQTRDAARVTVERFLLGLVGLRAIEDFLVLCDETNNTPERRDRSELWIDVLVKPIKAVEFIYVPVRIRSSADAMDY